MGLLDPLCPPLRMSSDISMSNSLSKPEPSASGPGSQAGNSSMSHVMQRESDMGLLDLPCPPLPLSSDITKSYHNKQQVENVDLATSKSMHPLRSPNTTANIAPQCELLIGPCQDMHHALDPVVHPCSPNSSAGVPGVAAVSRCTEDSSPAQRAAGSVPRPDVCAKSLSH